MTAQLSKERLKELSRLPTIAHPWEVKLMADALMIDAPPTYERTIYRSLAKWLCQLVVRYQREPRWYSTGEPWSLLACRGTGDIAKLRYWGLIEKKPNDDPKKKHSGLWRPTDDGIAFVRGGKMVPRNVQICDGRFVGLCGEPVSISDCLKEEFDYSKLMAEVVA